ncbi:pyrrolo-quinoline quinone [Candidatus Acidianus copahuensis]|uniref:Pyrrolo-quinoline quinone n=1 Tax=Candidatus Acidianus copahuensis TaxID=1160895 RepID=A0A031LQ26_9CREN|nr:PQQ-like beta-propeller repeat protein [Candidatus Acidianus copahuensis]EZQ04928.1 pyrrolo-quinoline quinone [Candidatus Acidianus copahuensis]
MKLKLIAAIIVSIILVGFFLNLTFLAQPQVQPNVQALSPITTSYYQYNGTYFPYIIKVTYYPGNASSNMGFPDNWPVTNYNQEFESVVNTSCLDLQRGVSWELPADMLGGGVPIPLSTPASQLPASSVIGQKAALVFLTQDVGQPLGVSLADNLLFVEEDSGPGTVVAVNPVTGNVVWYATGLASMAMQDPVVDNGIVYVPVGDIGFTFTAVEHALKNITTGVYRGSTYGAIYAFNASDGQLLWMRFTFGENMPDPAVYGGILAYATGGGCFIGLNATTGQVLWITKLPGYIDSMSSVNYYVLPNGTPIFIAGFTLTSYPYGELVAVNGENGNVLWKSQLPSDYIPYNTGMGDSPATVLQSMGIILKDTIANFRNGTVDTVIFAVNATNGDVLWVKNLGRGAVPPAFKASMISANGNVAYVGVPSLGEIDAISVSNGNIIWSTRLPDLGIPPTEPGGPRGAPVIYHGYLISAAGSSVYVISPEDGKVISMYNIGGRFGIVYPVIAGNTIFLTNSYGWVMALPLTEIYAGL